MEERIVKFIAALRVAGVRISLAESADAFRAIDSLGIKDREVFKLSLQTTLVKDANNLPVFDEMFPIFFGSEDNAPMTNPSEDLTPEEGQMLADALRQFSEQLRKMLEKLLNGQQLSQEELDRLAKMVGLSQMDNLHYREWMVQRMKKALRFKEVQEALKELAGLLEQMGMNKQRARAADAVDAGQSASFGRSIAQFCWAAHRREYERATARRRHRFAYEPSVQRLVRSRYGPSAEGGPAAGERIEDPRGAASETRQVRPIGR